MTLRLHGCRPGCPFVTGSIRFGPLLLSRARSCSTRCNERLKRKLRSHLLPMMGYPLRSARYAILLLRYRSQWYVVSTMAIGGTVGVVVGSQFRLAQVFLTRNGLGLLRMRLLRPRAIVTLQTATTPRMPREAEHMCTNLLIHGAATGE